MFCFKCVTFEQYYFRIPGDISHMDLSVEKAPRQDVMFMKKVCV